MRKLTPIDTEGDSAAIHEALTRMFVRCAQMARRRPSPLEIRVSGASVSVISAMESYFEGAAVEDVVAKIDGILRDEK